MALTGTYDPELLTGLYEGSIPYLGVVRDVLQPHSDQLATSLWDTLHDTAQAADRRFRAGFALATYEQQFARKLTPEEPAFSVTWFESMQYCRVLTQQAGWPEGDQCYGDPESLSKDAEGNPQQLPLNLDRRGFRLLTEAEWEYVCRSGTRTAFSFGSDRELLKHYAWFQDNSEQWSHAAGLLRPNLRGLFDVHGNLYEWCQDWYGDQLSNDATDPTGAEARSDRVVRGGSWNFPASICRLALRNWSRPGGRDYYLGFRVATVPSAGSAVPASPVSPTESGSR